MPGRAAPALQALQLLQEVRLRICKKPLRGGLTLHDLLLNRPCSMHWVAQPCAPSTATPARGAQSDNGDRVLRRTSTECAGSLKALAVRIRRVMQTLECRCVRHFDHHCPVVNNCVGARNQRAFISYTLLLFLANVLFLYLVRTAMQGNCPGFCSQAAQPPSERLGMVPYRDSSGCCGWSISSELLDRARSVDPLQGWRLVDATQHQPSCCCLQVPVYVQSLGTDVMGPTRVLGGQLQGHSTKEWLQYYQRRHPGLALLSCLLVSGLQCSAPVPY